MIGQNRRGNWTFLFPVGELHLMEAVNREYRVDRVTFVHRDKLPRVRRRMGFRAPVSEIKKRLRHWDFFDEAYAFAVVRKEGAKEEVERQCLDIVREELSILALSHLGYSQREQMEPIVAPGEVPNSYATYLALDSRSQAWFGNQFKRTVPFAQSVLDGRWKNYQDKMFFTNLLKILQGQTNVEDSWRRELRRASVLIGESVGANDLFQSFVWNMVALEMLLTRQQDRVRDALPSRAEAFLGWTAPWSAEGYEERIRDVYGKRNAFLHGGRREGISERDLAFTDHLLLNVLINLARHPDLFPSKAAVTQFSERVEAERLLGIKPKVRPASLVFTISVRPDF